MRWRRFTLVPFAVRLPRHLWTRRWQHCWPHGSSSRAILDYYTSIEVTIFRRTLRLIQKFSLSICSQMKALSLIVAAAILTGCATATTTTDDPRRAVVLAPFLRSLPPFGQIHVAEGTVLYASKVNGQPAWCSTTPIYFAPGEFRAMCLFDPAGGEQSEGWLKSAYIAGSLASLRYDVDIPYRVTQSAALPPRR